MNPLEELPNQDVIDEAYDEYIDGLIDEAKET